MEYYKSLFNKLGEIDFPTIMTNKRIKYINLPCGFDIETTSYKIEETKAAFMYVWMIGIGHNTGVYYGRTWEELQQLCLFIPFLTVNLFLYLYILNEINLIVCLTI